MSTLLREIRERAGMSMSELARKIGASPSDIWTYEHGSTIPKVERQIKIAAVFGVKVQTIFNGSPKFGRKKGGQNRFPTVKKLKAGQALCIWCGNITNKDIRIIGADEDGRRYCSVHCIGQYIWTR